MIIWLTGRAGAGKTTLAKELVRDNADTVLIDGDVVRAACDNWDFTKEGRLEHNWAIAREAVRLSELGRNVVVATICPYAKQRADIRAAIGCSFIYLLGGDPNCLYEDEGDAVTWRIGAQHG